MRKLFLSVLMVLNIGLQANEWYGFIPVCIKKDTPYFLLRTQSDKTTAEIKIIPLVGDYLPENQNKADFLQMQLQTFQNVTNTDIKTFFNKLPYLFYQGKSDTNHRHSCFRFWWPSSFSQLQTEHSDSRGLKDSATVSAPFFGSSSSQEPNALTHSTSSKYKIYFVPLDSSVADTLSDEQTQWFSLEDIAEATAQTPSPFLDRFTMMLKNFDHGASQQWETAKRVIKDDILNHLKTVNFLQNGNREQVSSAV